MTQMLMMILHYQTMIKPLLWHILWKQKKEDGLKKEKHQISSAYQINDKLHFVFQIVKNILKEAYASFFCIKMQFYFKISHIVSNANPEARKKQTTYGGLNFGQGRMAINGIQK